MAKISIIGAAGTLGAAVTFQLAKNPDITELCLIDINENLLLNHLMDLQNAFPSKKMYHGTYADLAHSQIIIITAGIPNRNDITSRNSFLEGNIKLFNQFGEKIKHYAPNALIITASNPVDTLNYYLYKEFSFHPRQLIGYTMNDSLRFEWALRAVLSKDDDVLYTPVIGEHGGSQVPIFSKVTSNGKPLNVSSQEQKLIKSKLQNWFVEFNALNVNRTTGWTTATGISVVIDKLLNEDVTEMIGSTILEGVYGVEKVSLGAPILVNKNGIQDVIEWKLDDEEKKAFQLSAETVSNSIQSVLKNGTNELGV